MKLSRIFGWLPVPVWYTDRFIPERFGAISLGLFVLIRPTLRDDEGLLEHELEHCRQCWRTWWSHPFRYWLNLDYRYRAEIEAWQVQIALDPGAEPVAIEMLTTAYGLDVSAETAARDLRAGAPAHRDDHA